MPDQACVHRPTARPLQCVHEPLVLLQKWVKKRIVRRQAKHTLHEIAEQYSMVN